MTGAYEINPRHDPRWGDFLARHAHATVFHTAEWLEALHRTYGYEIAAVTTSPPQEELTNALAFCRVRSWLTGRRIVSVPFSDHCTPLVSEEEQLPQLLAWLRRERNHSREKYVEIRSLQGNSGIPQLFSKGTSYCFHRLDLRPSLDELFRVLHRDCIRRKILRARREQFLYQEGRSEPLLRDFYRLALDTRRRHKLPPQPLKWFRNLIDCLGDRLSLQMLFRAGEPAAGILTMTFRDTVTYKYGFSDQRFHREGAMQLLLWSAIEGAKERGAAEFDMGRSDWSNPSLITFKDRWGCSRSVVTHLRYPNPQPEGAGLKMRIAKEIFGVAPHGFLRMAGNLLYRHMA